MIPTTPQKLAGCLIEPPVSVPVEPKHKSAATAAAEPPDEPPGAKGVSFLESGLNFDHPNEVLLSVFLLGFLCTGMAYMGYVVLIKRVGPVKASTVVLIVPVSGMLWANLFLNEAITSTMLLGCLLIITGVGLVNFFKDKASS